MIILIEPLLHARYYYQPFDGLVAKSYPTLATLWNVAFQAPLFTWDFPGKNSGVGCHFLFHWWSKHPCWGVDSYPRFRSYPLMLLLLLLLSHFSRVWLCDPMDCSPPGSPVPGILQAGTLEWVAISFSNAWKWKEKVKSLSRVRLFATPWTAAYQAPPSMGFSKQQYWSKVPLPSLPLMLSLLYIHLVIHVEEQLLRFHEQTQRYVNGEILYKLHILSLIPNYHTSIAHVFLTADLKQAESHFMSILCGNFSRSKHSQIKTHLFAKQVCQLTV